MSMSNKPVANYIRKDGDGVAEELEIKFASQETNYLRLRFKDACDTYVSPDTIMAVMTEVEAFGVESYYDISEEEKKNKVAAQFTDPATGFKFEILKLNENDIYRDLISMQVKKTSLSTAEKKAIRENGALETNENYRLNLVNYLNQYVEDFEGRTIRVSVPSNTSDFVYLAGYDLDEFTLLNAHYEGNFLVYEFTEESPNLLFSIVKESDSFDDEDYEDEDYDDEDYDEEDEEEPDEDYDDGDYDDPSNGGKKVRIRKVTSLNMPLIIALGAGALVVIGGGVTAAVILIKKRKKIK